MGLLTSPLIPPLYTLLGISAEIQRLRLSGLEIFRCGGSEHSASAAMSFSVWARGTWSPPPGTGPDPKEKERSYKSQRVAVADLLNTIAAAG